RSAAGLYLVLTSETQMSNRYTTGVVALSVAGAVLSGCANAPEQTPPQPIEGSTSELIGGVAANSAALDAIGTLGITESTVDCITGERVTRNRFVCTASLIDEKTVLTAKHCVQALRELGPHDVPYFAIGADGKNPSRVISIVDARESPVNVGGFNDLGRDVAVAYLESPVTDVKPLGIAELTKDAIGTRFGAIGYGVQNNADSYGTRMAGNVTLNALEGRVYELIFGSFEAYRDWFLSTQFFDAAGPIGGARAGAIDGGVVTPSAGDAGAGPILVGSDAGVSNYLEQYLRSEYENTRLLPGYEAYVGNRPGDAQVCFGDSGSPLVRTVNGQLVAYGVVSGGIDSLALICDYGAVYGSFGPETVSFLADALTWTDPCHGVSTHGSCDGAVATRCTGPTEGSRRLTATDCALFGQACAIGADGLAACAAPGEEPIVLEEHEACSGPDLAGEQI
ncbi:MAG: hypothetical protein JWN04_2795, partial [Myxococcaceae bacterium]|nr:hypothetical protein [Myxococcaceae bacterium]